MADATTQETKSLIQNKVNMHDQRKRHQLAGSDKKHGR